MTISIHQPQYIPWGPYFSKILASDIFVFLDDVQYQKNGLQNRNYIINNGKEQRLTIPVSASSDTSINDAIISKNNILQKHWITISQIYGKAKYYEEISQFLKPIFHTSYKRLSEVNIDLILMILRYLNIKTKILRASNIPKNGVKSTLILSICKSLNGNVYITGKGGMEYLDKEAFSSANISIKLLDYPKLPYSQIKNEGQFLPNLSIIDLLFNEGKNAINYL